MGTITAMDGTPIFYKDWGTGRPVVSSHGWPLTLDLHDAVLVGHSASGGEVTRYIGRHGTSRVYDCVKAFSEPYTTEDLKKIDVPTLIIHGDDDQIVPIGAAALEPSKIVKDATLKIYPGAPHGLAQTTTYKNDFNIDLLNFLKS